MRAPKHPIIAVGLLLIASGTVYTILSMDIQTINGRYFQDQKDIALANDGNQKAKPIDAASRHAASDAGLEEASEDVQVAEELLEYEDLYRVQFGSVWYEARGYEYADNESYASYSNEDLLTLARTGDPIAEILAVTRLRGVDRYREEIEMIHESAVLKGMTASLGPMTAMYLSQHISDNAGDTAEEPGDGSIIAALIEPARDASLLKASVWALFSQMRGDPSGIQTIDMLRGNSELALSDEQVKTACSAANKLYRELNSKRQELGYPPFADNAPRLSYADLSSSGDLCESWPTNRFRCAEDDVLSGAVSVWGYRCSTVMDRRNGD